MPPKQAGSVLSSVRSDAIAQARRTGKNQPVKDKTGAVVYYVSPTGDMVDGPLVNKAKAPSKGGDKGAGVLDKDSRTTGIQQAKLTGQVQPVRDKAGNVLYYVDQQGNAGTDPQARSIPGANDAAGSISQQWVDTHGGGPGGTPPPAPAKQDPNAPPPPMSDADIAQGISDYDKAQNAFAHGGNQTLNGLGSTQGTDPLGLSPKGGAPTIVRANSGNSREVDVNGRPIDMVQTAAGNDTDSYYGQSVQAQASANAAFAALSMPQAYNAGTTFKWSQGAGGLTPQGTQTSRNPNGGYMTTEKQDNRQDLIAGPRGTAGNQPMNSAQQTNSAQYMSIGSALQVFMNMSVNDKDAYNQLVNNLNKAGYFADQSGGMNYLPESSLPLNGYSANAARALVEAAQDLSVAQSAGETSDMATWLQKRSQGYNDWLNNGAGYNNVNRSYQDPDTLKLAAKNAAQAAIGRNLTPDEEAKFEGAFRGKENSAYNEMDSYGRAKAVANATQKNGLPSGTPTSYTMPDTTGEADQYVNADPRFAQEKAGYQGLELTKGLMQFLKGGGF